MTPADLDALVARLTDPPLDDDAVCTLAEQAAAAITELKAEVARLKDAKLNAPAAP